MLEYLTFIGCYFNQINNVRDLVKMVSVEEVETVYDVNIESIKDSWKLEIIDGKINLYDFADTFLVMNNYMYYNVSKHEVGTILFDLDVLSICISEKELRKLMLKVIIIGADRRQIYQHHKIKDKIYLNETLFNLFKKTIIKGKNKRIATYEVHTDTSNGNFCFRFRSKGVMCLMTKDIKKDRYEELVRKYKDFHTLKKSSKSSILVE